MNRADVEEQLAPLAELQATKVYEGELSVELGQNGVELSGGAFGRSGTPLTEAGFESLLKLSGFPQRLLKGLHVTTAAHALTELLEQKNFTAVHTNDEIVDLVSTSRAANISIPGVLDTIDRVIPEADYRVVRILPHFGVQLEVSGAQEQAVVPGDLVRGGILTRFSPIGFIDPMVQPRVERLVCTNGATSFEVLREFHLGNDDIADFDHWLASSLTDAYGSFTHIVDQWRELTQHTIDPTQRALVLTGLLKKARVPARIADIVYAEAIERTPETAYDMLQLLTWATSHVIEDPERVIRAQAAAANFAEESSHARHCPTCNRPE